MLGTKCLCFQGYGVFFPFFKSDTFISQLQYFLKKRHIYKRGGNIENAISNLIVKYVFLQSPCTCMQPLGKMLVKKLDNRGLLWSCHCSD